MQTHSALGHLDSHEKKSQSIRLAICGLVCGLLQFAACNQSPPKPDLGAITGKDELFSLRQIPKFSVDLSEDSWNALLESPYEYVPGRFRYRDQVYSQVGVRLKGNLSFEPLDKKPSLKIKFNKYKKGERFIGLETLTLNNMHSDASMTREWIAYLIFRALGVPASRTGYAQVYVNDESYGLYLNLETIDDEFLEDRFKNPYGNLYEGEHGDDLDKDIEKFEQDEGDDTTRNDLLLFTELAQADGDDIFFSPETMLDTESFFMFSAAEAYIGHFDGYWNSHNYFLYHEPEIDKWYFIPWSLDQSFFRELNPFQAEGYLTTKCREQQTCLESYIPAAIESSKTIDNLKLNEELEKVLAKINSIAKKDNRKRFSNDTMISSQKSLRAAIKKRTASYQSDLDCLVDGREPDNDNDGHGPCFLDCDDNDPTLNAGQEEICDGIDNNCSGFADDVPKCPCDSHEVEGVNFYFCSHVLSWNQARRFCEDQGHHLAKFETRIQNDKVWNIAQEINPGRWAIGLNDKENENDYRWMDDTAPSFTHWANGQPAHALDWFDCVFFAGSSKPNWTELNCISEAPFVCSGVDSDR